MDMEGFIAEVRKRECLWDKKKIPFGAPQRKIANRHWEDIGKNFNISGELAKCKWRSLRDNFLKLLKKSPDKPNWIHFNKLIFLLSVYKPSQKAESVIDIHSSSDSDSSCNDTKTSANEEVSSPSPKPPAATQPISNLDEETSQPPTTNTIDNTLPKLREVFKLEENSDSNIRDVQVKEESECITTSDATILDIATPLAMIKPLASDPPFKSIKRIYTLEETNDLELSAPVEEQYKCSSKKMARESEVNCSELRLNKDCNDENENFSFFRSMLPFMNKLDPVQQLRVRMRFQEILMEELGA